MINNSVHCADFNKVVSTVRRVGDDNAVHYDTCIVAENKHRVYMLEACNGSVIKNIDLTFIVEKNASLRVELLIANTCATIKIQCIMRGESSNAIINGVYVTKNSDNITFSTVQHHEAAYTSSNLIIKGVADDSAHVAYSGMVRVEKKARCSISRQDHKALLLSQHACVISVPSLEVLTNDVHCFHGSAIGTFDQEKLFYAASRGIAQHATKKLLLQAFFAYLFENKEMSIALEELL